MRITSFAVMALLGTISAVRVYDQMGVELDTEKCTTCDKATKVAQHHAKVAKKHLEKAKDEQDEADETDDPKKKDFISMVEGLRVLENEVCGRYHTRSAQSDQLRERLCFAAASNGSSDDGDSPRRME